MKLSLVKGTTSKLVQVFIQDSSVTTGAGLTGLVYNTGSLTAYYYREGAGSAVAITLATMTLGTWASGGFIVVDGTNTPGAYQLGIPDAALASGANSVVIMLKGAANMAPVLLEIELTAVNNQSATAFITGVNSLAPPTNWNSMVIDGSGRVDVSKVSGTSQTARDIGGSVLLSSGTGTGQILLSSGQVSVSGGTVTVSGAVTLDAIDSGNLDAGTAQAGSSTTLTLRSGASSINNNYRGCILAIYGGTGAGQARVIASYTGSSKVATMDEAWVTTPDNTSTYRVLVVRAPQLSSTGSVKIQAPVKKGTALNGMPFYMRLNTGGPAIGLGTGLTAQRSIDGGSFGVGSLGAVAEIGSGWYFLASASASDMNGDSVALRFSGAGCVDTLVTLFPVA